jgi:monoamine oxidase
MHTERVDTLLVGGDLGDIYASFLLAAKKKSFVLLEARSRVGGRILRLEDQDQGIMAPL